MRVFNRTEQLAFEQRFPVKKQAKSWSLYYGNNKTAWYGPAEYGHCASERKRLMQSGNGYKEELFKIK